MPFLFLIVGTVMIVSAARGTNNDLVALLKADFTGQNNFLYWLVSILIIGAVGYIPDLKPVSRAFLVLVVIVLFLENGGVFTQFTAALKGTQSAQPNNTSSSSPQAVNYGSVPTNSTGSTNYGDLNNYFGSTSNELQAL